MIVVPGVLTLRIDVPGALNLGIVVHGDQLEQKKYLKTTKKTTGDGFEPLTYSSKTTPQLTRTSEINHKAIHTDWYINSNHFVLIPSLP